MTLTSGTKTAGAGIVLALAAILGMLINAPRGRAQDGSDDASRIQQGFGIAPVPLNLIGKNSAQVALVGLGSYWVNAVSDCNFCHNNGAYPNANFLADHNPYFLFQGPKKTDPTTYLGGGTDFGPALLPPPPGTPSAYAPGYGSYLGPDIITRNLTPDKTGLPEGGHTFSQFLTIMRTGVDMDHLHPTCTTVSTTPSPANCIPPPVDGSRLQIMPWPNFQDMSDRDIEAIYEYLSAIPCVAGPPAPSPLHNDCK